MSIILLASSSPTVVTITDKHSYSCLDMAIKAHPWQVLTPHGQCIK